MERKKEELSFTGNWYIDAGIIGFIKVLNWMYGWELEEIKRKVMEDSIRLYYGYFPLAYSFRYFFKSLKKGNEIKEKFEKIKREKIFELEEKIKDKNDGDEVYENVWDLIKGAHEELVREELLKKNTLDRLPFSSQFYTNFLMFNPNPKFKLEDQKEQLKKIVSGKYESEEELLYIDKSISKFLHSSNEFPNISYVPICTRDIDIFKKRYIFVYLVCVEHAFEYFGKDLGNIFFYSPTLDFCYWVNKRLEIAKESYNKKNNKENTLLRIVWRSVIDLLIEYKSIWSLEEMYIISYKRIKNQALENVEYIGIPKLQASILIDDEIRENLNRTIKIKIGNKEETYWIIEEFIKDKPLYPLIFSYIKTKLSREDKVNEEKSGKHTYYYSLIVDAKLLDLRSGKEEKEKSCVFSEKKTTYRPFLEKIKKDLRETYYYSGFIRGISYDKEVRKSLATELLSVLEKENKNNFLNLLLKRLNQNLDILKNENFIRWINKKIIRNDVSWKNYALILVLSLLI